MGKKKKYIYLNPSSDLEGFPGGLDGKECRRPGFNPWVGKIPWRREWQATPAFLPRESHGQRSLAGYSPWGLTESDTTERLTLKWLRRASLVARSKGHHGSQFSLHVRVKA